MDENKGNHPQAGFPRADNPPLVNTERELILIQIPTTRAKLKNQTPFPDDFLPNEKTMAVITARGLTEKAVQDEIEAMRDWAINAGSKSKKKDWQAFARNWFKKSKGQGHARPASRPNSIVDSFAAVDAAIAAEERRLREA
jgi:hypothetical protein